MTLNSGYVSAVMADSPWGFWQLQEAAGSVSAADSANAHGGTYDVAVVTGTGPFSGWSAVNFQGTNGVSVAGVKAQNTPMAFEMWAQLNTSGAQVGMSYASGAGTVGMEWGVYSIATCGPNAALGVHAPTNAWFCGSHPDFITSGWQYCVLQLESDSHWRIYIYNVGAGTYSIDDIGIHSMNAPTTPTLTIGKDSTNGSRMNALVSAVAWYDHALTPAQIDAHFHAAGSVLAPGCIYGSHAKPLSPYTAIAEDYLLQKILSRWHLEWMSSLIYYALGEHVDVNYLCSLPPPVPPPLDAGAFLNAGKYSIPWLHRLLWDEFCECLSGPLGKPDNPPITQAQPAGWFVYSPITVNATNPCLDITDVRRMLQVILQAVSSDVRVDVGLQQGLLPTATSRGATTTGLTGSGSFAVSNAIGVQVVITARPPGGRELEGAPPYIWDAGWLSIMDGNGFIQERRLTRDVEVWMPRLMSDAITFGYFFKDGVTADVTVLYAFA